MSSILKRRHDIRGATAFADAENKPMEPETDNADAGMRLFHEFFCKM